MGKLVPFVLCVFFSVGYYTNPLNKENPEDLTPLSDYFECPKFLLLIIFNLCLDASEVEGLFFFKDMLRFKKIYLSSGLSVN